MTPQTFDIVALISEDGGPQEPTRFRCDFDAEGQIARAIKLDGPGAGSVEPLVGRMKVEQGDHDRDFTIRPVCYRLPEGVGDRREAESYAFGLLIDDDQESHWLCDLAGRAVDSYTVRAECRAPERVPLSVVAEAARLLTNTALIFVVENETEGGRLYVTEGDLVSGVLSQVMEELAGWTTDGTAAGALAGRAVVEHCGVEINCDTALRVVEELAARLAKLKPGDPPYSLTLVPDPRVAPAHGGDHTEPLVFKFTHEPMARVGVICMGEWDGWG